MVLGVETKVWAELEARAQEGRAWESLATGYAAAKIGIAPGIVVGHLQQLGWLRASWCNQLKHHLGWAPPGTEADPQVY
ncbi:MAG: hypothetical protein GY722_12680 [bacterium]|nr:hypothetical protein [bacterium]